MDVNQYKKLLNQNITSNYKKADQDTAYQINKQGKSLTSKLKIDNRVEIPAKKECYITVKDHKPGFPHDIKCRLINPCKSNIGKITKQILDRVNNHIKTVLNLDLLDNTASAISWFNQIKDKNNKQMIQIDIVDYYPSIDRALFDKAITFAEKITPLSNLEKELLINARQSILYSEGIAWEKNTGTFDVTMGSFDGAQITDLVGLMILNTLKTAVPEISFALYRDDGIGAHHKLSAKKLEGIKKTLHKLFKELGLKITIETGLHKMDFLDVSFNLIDESYAPYHKPNDIPTYVNAESNHPSHVLKNIPIAVNKRLSEISKTEEIFNASIGLYQDALKRSGYNHTLTFNPTSNPPHSTLPHSNTPATTITRDGPNNRTTRHHADTADTAERNQGASAIPPANSSPTATTTTPPTSTTPVANNHRTDPSPHKL